MVGNNNTQPCPIRNVTQLRRSAVEHPPFQASTNARSFKWQARGSHTAVSPWRKQIRAGLPVTEQLQFKTVAEAANIGKLATAGAELQSQLPTMSVVPRRDIYSFIRSFVPHVVYSLNKPTADDPRLRRSRVDLTEI